jgi:hypothetical protein
MSDFDQTVYSAKGASGMSGAPQPATPPPAPAKKRNPLLIIAGVGCALLLCGAILAGVGLFMARDQLQAVVAGLGGTTPTPTSASATPTEAAAISSPAPTEEVTAEATSTEAATVEATVEAATATPTEEATPTPLPEPKFGSVTFALGTTEDYKPVDAGITFQEGITEVHAIFEYSGMSKDYTWERVWYLDGKEVLRNAQKWTGDETGVFDYFIDAGNDPLFPGKWDLELYIQNKLAQTGSFTNEAKEGRA